MTDRGGDRPPAQESRSVAGIRLFMFAAEDVCVGRSTERFQLSIHTVEHRSRPVAENGRRSSANRMETVEGVTDVSSDRDPGGLQLSLSIDRQRASGLGVRVQDIDNALNNAFSQRQISYHLHPMQPVCGGAGDLSELSGDPSNLDPSFVAAPTRAGTAFDGGALSTRIGAARGFSFASGSVDDGLVQSGARCAARNRDVNYPACGRGAAYARGHLRQL